MNKCPLCRKDLTLEALRSAAGFYVGTFCCGPVSRDSDYYASREEAQAALETGTFSR
jgi:hypothetical protein